MQKPSILSLVICAVLILAVLSVLVVYNNGYFETLQLVQGVSTQTPPPDIIADDSFALGEYYFNQSPYNDGTVYDLEKARHYYQQSIIQATQNGKIAPTYAWYNLAKIDFIQKKFDGAISKLEKQLAVHGDAVPQTYYMLGLAHGYRAPTAEVEGEAEVDWQAAEANFTQFMAYAPDSPWPRVDLAWVYFGQGKFEQMLPLLEEGIAINGDHAWLLNTYGLALLNSGDKAGAREAFTKAQQVYQNLTVDDWSNAYRENDPSLWNRNFELFGATIDYNLSLAEGE